jgi:hypothetical protein
VFNFGGSSLDTRRRVGEVVRCANVVNDIFGILRSENS